MSALEDYGLTLAHVEKLLDRRQSITTFYLSVNAAIATVVGFLLKDTPLQQDWLSASILLLLAAGIGACWIWRSLLRQYALLLSWWYARLRELEAVMPGSAQLITREYQDLYGSSGSAKSLKRVSMTQRELALNWVITGLYVIFSVGILLSLLVKTP